MVTVDRHDVLYRAPRFHAAFPSIARFSDDCLLLAFRRARDALWLLADEQRQAVDPFDRMDHIDSRSHTILVELDENGQPLPGLDMMPPDPEAADQDPSLLILPQDRVFLASFSWYPLPADATQLLHGRAAPGTGDNDPGCRYLFWGSHTALRNREQGHWIGHHRYLQPDAGFGRNLDPDGLKGVVGPVRGQPVLHEDEILLPVYATQEGSLLFASADHGATWRFRAVIAHDADGIVRYQEPALCTDGSGGLVCFMRTAGAGGRLATSHSVDGACWSEPTLHDLVGHPFHPLLLSDGRVLLSYGYRIAPYGIRARLLTSPTTDPDGAAEVVIRDDGLCPDLGYPWGVQLRDGRILLAYYWTGADGIRHIAASRLIVEPMEDIA